MCSLFFLPSFLQLLVVLFFLFLQLLVVLVEEAARRRIHHRLCVPDLSALSDLALAVALELAADAEGRGGFSVGGA